MKPYIKNTLILGGTGFVLYLVFLVVLFPASLAWKLAPDNLKRQVQVSGIQGRIWNGTAQNIVANRNELGKLSWTLSPWSLFRATASGSFVLNREPESLSGNYQVSGPDRFQLSDVRLRIQGESLQSLTRPFVLHGSITASIDSIDYQSGEKVHMQGMVNLRNTQVEGMQNIQLGNVEADISPDGNGSLASFSNQDSPLDIQGKVSLNPAGQFDLNMGILNRDRTRKDLDNMLAILGKPDVTGRVMLNYTRRIQLP